jgi:hypothetical protein
MTRNPLVIAGIALAAYVLLIKPRNAAAQNVQSTPARAVSQFYSSPSYAQRVNTQQQATQQENSRAGLFGMAGQLLNRFANSVTNNTQSPSPSPSPSQDRGGYSQAADSQAAYEDNSTTNSPYDTTDTTDWPMP